MQAVGGISPGETNHMEQLKPVLKVLWHNGAIMESMADAHPRFLLELLVAHRSDLQLKQQSKICVRMC